MLIFVFYFLKFKCLENFSNRVNNGLINIEIDKYNEIMKIVSDLEEKKFDRDLNVSGNITGQTITDLNNRINSLNTTLSGLGI